MGGIHKMPKAVKEMVLKDQELEEITGSVEVTLEDGNVISRHKLIRFCLQREGYVSGMSISQLYWSKYAVMCYFVVLSKLNPHIRKVFRCIRGINRLDEEIAKREKPEWIDRWQKKFDSIEFYSQDELNAMRADEIKANKIAKKQRYEEKRRLRYEEAMRKKQEEKARKAAVRKMQEENARKNRERSIADLERRMAQLRKELGR